jgi:hypothetical protein
MPRKDAPLAGELLAHLGRIAICRGVTLETWGPLPGNRVVLAWICRNEGATSEDVDTTMRDLCGVCDQRGLKLELNALGGATGLVSFYERYGFALDDPAWMPSDKDEAGPSMRRRLGAPISEAPVRDQEPASAPSPGR